MAHQQILTPSSYRSMPWKNEAGVTTEIAIHPATADLDSFLWRVSVADIEHDGAFSTYEDVDRMLVLLSGAGMLLTGAGGIRALRQRYESHRFPGDARIDCKLIDGPVRDFNLMLRRRRARGTIEVVLQEGRVLTASTFMVCYAAMGGIECAVAGGDAAQLREGETLLVSDASGQPLRVQPRSPAGAAVVASIEVA